MLKFPPKGEVKKRLTRLTFFELPNTNPAIIKNSNRQQQQQQEEKKIIKQNLTHRKNRGHVYKPGPD